jgi:hypothetical protein
MEQQEKYNWNRLNHLQLGKYAEYYTKMEFTLYGFDVYSSEVDDIGIDLVIRKENSYFDVQVKSIKGYNYIFFPESKFILRKNLLASILVFHLGVLPKLYLIPSMEWRNTNDLLVYHDYIGKQSNPEYGLNISRKNLEILDRYSFDKMVLTL